MATKKASGFTRVNIADMFLGVNQANDGRYLKKGESQQAYNSRTDKGVLSTAAGYSKHVSVALAAAPVTPMLFFEYKTDGTVTKHLLAATANNIYVWNGAAWASIKGAETVSNGDFSFANYREAGVSKIIMSNGTDPVYQWTGTGDMTKLYYVAGPPVLEAPRGDCITVHVERLWVGGVTGSPQTVFASDAYAPTNWVIEDTGAGYITVSTWDGGSVVGLAALLGDVVCFKQNSIFRIVGTYPDEFQPVQVYTMEGTIAPRSICQYNNRAYFLSDDGIMEYDSVKAYELLPLVLRDFWSGVNKAALGVACGIAHNNVVYMAVPYGANQATNNYVIEYNLITKTVAIRKSIAVTRFLEDNEDLLFVGPGNYVYAYDSGTTLDGTAIAMEWSTPITDFGTTAMKYTYDMYLYGWTDTEGGQAKVSIMVDGAVAATKTFTLPAAKGLVHAPVRAHGRSMSFKVENVNGSKINIVALDCEFEVVED